MYVFMYIPLAYGIPTPNTHVIFVKLNCSILTPDAHQHGSRQTWVNTVYASAMHAHIMQSTLP